MSCVHTLLVSIYSLLKTALFCFIFSLSCYKFISLYSLTRSTSLKSSFGFQECPIVCHVCRESHGDRSCPEEELPSLIPLPKLTEEDIEILEDVACEVFGKYII